MGNGSQLWTFHLDTLTYTTGCNVVDFLKLQHVPCDVFMYTGTASVLPLYQQHGKATACATFGNTVVGVLAGRPQPGPVVCDAPSSSNPEGVFSYCGLGSTDYPPMTSRWQFVPLPVASGPVTGATFDSAAGTACVRVGAQAFTFTVATRAVTPGCAAGTPAPAATATP
ncbi:MAG: hypothetical protein KGK07_06215 [Chloroflexota bacterium]|nr:hypothetical protein [Chloroflexota bacterium]